jgi:transposase
MAQPKSVVGLDVHATQTHACVLSPETGELRSKRLNGPPRRALDHLEGLQEPVLAVYEAGPTGYGLARGGAERGLDVRVCAPGSIPKAPSDRIKTDRRDAERLARLCLAGELSFVRVPSPEEERFRDLARAREAIRADLMRARHRLGKFLLRRELRWEGPGSSWTRAHWTWLRRIEFPDGASGAVLGDYLAAVVALEQRRGTSERAIEELWAESPWAETIARLRCLRGISTLTALGLCAEAGDLRRFDRPSSLVAYFGIVPSEHSSGEQVRRGPITKAGSPHARRLLVEAAHHYRHRPAVGAALERRQRGADPRAAEIGWRAQCRLHQRWRRLRLERGKPGNVVRIALARELGCFVWEVGQLD